MNVHEWIDYGIERGWVTAACATHDGIPMTGDEEDAWEEGLDPCQPVLRVWFDGKPSDDVPPVADGSADYVVDGVIYRRG